MKVKEFIEGLLYSTREHKKDSNIIVKVFNKGEISENYYIGVYDEDENVILSLIKRDEK